MGALPFAGLATGGAVLGFLCGSLLRIRRRHVTTSLRRAGLDPAAASAMYRSLGAGVLELLWLAGRRRPPLDEMVTLDDDARAAIERARGRGRGMVVAATHTGNWDLAACAVAARVPLLIVTKHLSVRALDVFWQTTRARFGVVLASAEAALGRGRSHLAQGGAVAMMIDQVPLRMRHGVRGEFLGDRAWLDKAPATLAARSGAPLVVSAARRDHQGRQVVSALCVLEPPEDAGRAWIESATREATAALDAYVRRHPEAWLWMHRRWKAPAS